MMTRPTSDSNTDRANERRPDPSISPPKRFQHFDVDDMVEQFDRGENPAT
jgi:hypothetical protein